MKAACLVLIVLAAAAQAAETGAGLEIQTIGGPATGAPVRLATLSKER